MPQGTTQQFGQRDPEALGWLPIVELPVTTVQVVPEFSLFWRF